MIRLPRRLRMLPVAVLAGLLAAILAFLYLRTQGHDPADYFRNVASLRQLKQLDARWELDVLRSRTGGNANYDALVDSLVVITDLQQKLSTVLAEQEHGSATQLDAAGTALRQAIEAKAQLIDNFKSHNSILRNSLSFLSHAAGDAQEALAHDGALASADRRRIADQLTDILLDTLLYSDAPSAEKAMAIERAVEQLNVGIAGLAPASAEGLEIFASHVRTILREQPLVDSLVLGVDAVPATERIDALDSLLGAEQQAQNRTSGRYRQYLLLFAAALAGLVLYAAASLIRSHAVIRRVNRQLQATNATLEQRVEERTRELQVAQRDLVSAARQAGMAEIATNVLHNVGNVLNSVNVSAGLVTTRLRGSRAKSLPRAVQMLEDNAARLGEFMTSDPKGRMLPGYLRELSRAVEAEQDGMTEELDALCKSVDHIKDIVSTQQSYAGASRLLEPVRIGDLIEDALRMNSGSLMRHKVSVVKTFADVPPVPLDRHRVLQILVNVLSNAKHALDASPEGEHRIHIEVEPIVDGKARIRVSDNGEGIAPDNLARIFTHGFTTRKNGHGFGLHSCVLAAREMGGTLGVHSDGPGRGASFTLELPVAVEEAVA